MQGDQHRQHISGQFNAELDAMKNHLLEMGGLVEQQVAQAMASLLMRDSGEATSVIRRDQEVDALEMQIDEECSRILARRQPAASDLRLVLAVAKSTTDLERIGDEASKIARQAVKLSEMTVMVSASSEFRELGQQVTEMLRHALDSFARLDVRRAIEVVVDDTQVDRRYDGASESLVLQMKENSETIHAVMHLLWALKSLERIGDHATNIAEQVVYLVKGRDVRHMNAREWRELLENENNP